MADVLTGFGPVILALFAVGALLLLNAVRVVQEYERG